MVVEDSFFVSLAEGKGDRYEEVYLFGVWLCA